jgi:GR25 family glycosyltransferase involved in LPS biosynthesis
MSDNPDSVRMVEDLEKSIRATSTNISLERFEAVVPKGDQGGTSITDAMFEVFGNSVRWTWPTENGETFICFRTGLHLKQYPAIDQRRVKACALSHFSLWKKCADLDEPIVVLEHDAYFTRKFDPENYADEEWGVIGLNDPRGNTRKGQKFNSMVSRDIGVQQVPQIDETSEPPLPMGIAGNSAYIIRPHAAKDLLAKTLEVGMWPNDAIMCRQIFPWLRVTYPYYTNVQAGISTTTKL